VTLATNIIGLAFSIAAVWLAVVMFRRPLSDTERHIWAWVVAAVAFAAMAYRLGRLT
jgi:uncharacterized BrkB/YihY/UPF0761 family membrane protein